MTDDDTTYRPVEVVSYVTVAARVMVREADDLLHVMSHSFEGGNGDCPTCIAAHERQAEWERENPPCPTCGRSYDD